ncbi:hypothetical protein [Rickettsia massiliae]|nr:hypothetical protein [Rickettsia massiliae]
MEEDRWIEKLTSYAEIKSLCDSKFLALEKYKLWTYNNRRIFFI